MKTIALAFLCMTALPLLAAESLPLWSGRLQTLPGDGKWELLSAHGRVLAAGTGEIKIELAALADGARVDAKLKTTKSERDVTLLSPRILAGIAATFDCEKPSMLQEKLSGLGLLDAAKLPPPDDETPTTRIHISDTMTVVENDLTLVFPKKKDFPIKLGQNWEKIILNTAKKSGTLSVYIDGSEQNANCRGNGDNIELIRDKTKVVLFDPTFDLDDPENIILLEHLMEGYKK